MCVCFVSSTAHQWILHFLLFLSISCIFVAFLKHDFLLEVFGLYSPKYLATFLQAMNNSQRDKSVQLSSVPQQRSEKAEFSYVKR